MDPAEAQLYLGQVLANDYEVLEFRGSGAFAGVFRASQRSTGREVAAKILSLASSQSPSAVNEFAEEKRLLEMLASCSNIIDLIDSGQHVLSIQVAGQPATLPIPVSYLILEFADASLAELLAYRHRLSWADRLALYRHVVKGTHQMHLARIIHRDAKSDNVLVVGGKQPIAKLSDLGRSKDTREPHRATKLDYQVGRGDPNFAPPEFLWLLGEADAVSQLQADLYLMGSILFEFATGVGLTAFVLGHPMSVLAQAMKIPDEQQRRRHYASMVPSLRDDYELAYETFRAEVPRVLSVEATALLRQLTDPDPTLREPRRPLARRGLPTRWDLQWLLRRVDILSARLATPKRRTRRPSTVGQKGTP